MMQKTKAQKNIGVVLLNLGGPERLEDVEPFLFNLFSDRMIIRLGPAFMQKTIARFISRRRAPKSAQAYAKIGGGSPLGKITADQAKALEKELSAFGNFTVSVAMRYWYPRAQETLAALQNEDVQRIIALPLYPHYSLATTGSSVADLIEKLIQEGDPYVEHLKQTINAVEAITGMKGRLCYQSRSGPVEWLSPSPPETLEELAKEGCKNVLMVPISFVSDHVETLYEIDMLYRDMAHDLGIRLERSSSLNLEPEFINGLKELVLEKAKQTGWL
jgi:ferrochelatase